MNREISKILEYEFGKAFFTELNEGELDLLIHDDDPDFFTNEGMHIGFEITQIFNFTPKGDSKVHIEGSRNNLLIKLKEIWDSHSLPFCHVKLRFEKHIPVSKKKANQIAEEIANVISDYIPQPNSIFRSPNSMYIDIPNLFGFVIERFDFFDATICSYYDSHWTSSLNPEQIQNTINFKELKRENYLKRCNEIWLVIALYGGKLSEDFIITQSTIIHKYNCNFDRLFLFDCIPKKYYELNFKK